MDRHTAKGSQLNRRSSIASQTASAMPNSPNPSGMGSGPGDIKPPAQLDQYQTPHSPSMNSYGHLSHTPPMGYANMGPVHSMAGTHSPSFHSPHGSVSGGGPIQYGMVSPHHQAFTHPNSAASTGAFVPQHNVMPFHLPPAQYAHSPIMTPQDVTSPFVGPVTDYPETSHAHSAAELALLDQMAMPGTAPVFGDGANKSPYVGMPEDFMAYLFNSPAAQAGSHSPMVIPTQYNR